MSDEADNSARRLLEGRWTYRDFLTQLQLMRRLGPLLRTIPDWDLDPDDRADEFEKVLQAMTPDELKITELLDPKRGPARRERIAKKAGVSPGRVLKFVKTFAAMERAVERVVKNGPWGLDDSMDE